LRRSIHLAGLLLSFKRTIKNPHHCEERSSPRQQGPKASDWPCKVLMKEWHGYFLNHLIHVARTLQKIKRQYFGKGSGTALAVGNLAIKLINTPNTNH